MSAVHPHGKANAVAKVLALACFAIAAALLIASLMTSSARATKTHAPAASVSILAR